MAKPIKITILGDASQLDRTVQGVQSTLGGLASGIGRLGLAIGGAFAATQVVDFARDSVGAASDLQESLSKANVVFGEQAAAIDQWARGAAASMGMSRQQALEAAGTFGNLFRAMQIGTPQAADMSQGIIQLASDLASFNNASPEDVLLALRSGLVGETEPLRRFGINLSAARIEAKALEMGLADANGEVSAGAKAQAAYALIMEDSSLAQGDFARTSDGLANQQRILGAQFEDLKARIGTALLPVFQGLVSFIMDKGLPAFEEIAGGIQAFVAAFRAGDGDITSSGFPGFMERVAYIARQVFDAISAKVREWGPTVVAVFQTVQGVIGRVIDFFRSKGGEGEATISRLGGTVDRLRTMFSSAFEAIRLIVDRVVTFLVSVWDRWGQHFVRYLQETVGRAIAILDGIVGVLTGVFDLIKAILTGKWGEAWDAIYAILTNAWQVLTNLLAQLGHALGTILQGALAVLATLWSGAWNAAKTLLSDIWAGIRNTVASGIDGIMGFIGGIPGRIRGFIGAVAGAAAELGGSILSGIGNGLRNVVSFAADVAGAVRDAVIGAINWVIDRLNDGIPNSLGWGPASIDIPDNPIPRIARAMGGPASGWVDVGERGKERVFLPQGSTVVPNHALGSTGAAITINVAQTGASARDIAAEVAWALKTSGR